MRSGDRDGRVPTKRLWRWKSDDRLAARQGGHRGGRYYGNTRHAQGLATWVRRERLSVQRPTAPGAALARTRLATHEAIYGDVVGPEERAFAARMWQNLQGDSETLIACGPRRRVQAKY